MPAPSPTVTVSGGADRCPGALRPHRAADGTLIRVRLPGGQLTADQLRALATCAAREAAGTLELTSRGNVQIRGIRDDAAVRRAADRLADAGLLPSATHERVRNIVASPLNGRDGRGADVRALVRDFDAALRSAPDLAALSGRFLVAFDDGRGDVAGLGADLCWIAGTGAAPTAAQLTGSGAAPAAARIPGASVAPGAVRLTGAGAAPGVVLIAGEDHGVRAAADAAVATLVRAARVFLRLRGDRADLWRIADLPGGAAAIAGELGGHPSPAPAGPAYHHQGPAVGAYPRGFVVVGAPLGRLRVDQAELVADLAATPDLVVTPWRSVVLDGTDAAPLADAGLIVDNASPWQGVTACTGRPGCDSALADVQADARASLPDVQADATASLADVQADATASLADMRADATGTAGGLPVHWAGCGRCCGRPAGPAVIALATGAGYRVVGQSGDLGEPADPVGHRLALARRTR